MKVQPLKVVKVSSDCERRIRSGKVISSTFTSCHSVCTSSRGSTGWWPSVCYKYTCRVLCLCTWGWDEIQSVNHTQILDQCYLRKGKSRDDKEEASRAVELFCPPSVYLPVPTVPLWSSLHQRFKWSNRTKEDWTSWVLQSIIVAIHNWVAFKVQIPHWTGLSWLVFSNCLLAGISSRAD